MRFEIRCESGELPIYKMRPGLAYKLRITQVFPKFDIGDHYTCEIMSMEDLLETARLFSIRIDPSNIECRDDIPWRITICDDEMDGPLLDNPEFIKSQDFAEWKEKDGH